LPEPTLYILDVGHGNCAVLKDTEGIIVIDAGRGTTLLEFLKAENIKAIDYLLISHADIDHIGGIINLIESDTISVGMVCVNTDSAKDSNIWDDMLYEINNNGDIRLSVGLTTNSSGLFDKGAISISILSPSPYLASRGPGSTDRKGRRLSSNSNCVVIRLENGVNPLVLLAGDIDNVGFENLIEDNNQENINAPLAVFPHHGGKTGSVNPIEFASSFCEIIRPKTVVFSVGRRAYSNPCPEIIRYLRAKVPDVRIICTQLSTHCAKETYDQSYSHLTDKYSQGRIDNLCCAGTISIILRDEPLVLPDQDSLDSFIDRAAPTALCKV